MAKNRPYTSLDEILAIDGNRAVYERLKGLLADGSAMAFVGAGASFPLYPLWGQLIEQLADEPVRRGLAKDADKQHWLHTAAQKSLHVALRIRDKLKDQLYNTFLYETFKDRRGPDGQCFTPAHAALVQMNLKAILTTNYDPGLVEARRVLRPDIRDTGFAVWNQDFPINRWASGDLFRDGTQCPILFAHGHYADPASIVLDAASYHCAYQSTPYRRMFENLWIQEHLVFVGFSFQDVVLAQIADEVLWQTVRQGGGQPRHVAILGLPVENEYSKEMRHEYLEPFNAEVLFYPVHKTADGHPDHSALQVLLDSLTVSAKTSSQVLHPPPAMKLSAKIDFIHESTEDEKFTGRGHCLDRLDTWAADAGVRLLGITAIGGLGKTALIGRWLKDGRAEKARQAEGLFFWSYYRDHDTQVMLRELLGFGRKDLGWKPSAGLDKAAPMEQAMDLLCKRRIIVALDGLEVVQESPGTVAYGKLLAPDLADLLHRHCRTGDGSLVVLTSRFPFPDLTSYLGGSMRIMPLPELEPAEGAGLLASLGVAGRAADREEISRQLSGHPLALRVFARSMPADLAGDPTRLWKQIFDAPHLAGDDSLAGKMQRLLTFYEQQLSDADRLALGLLALFRMPVGERTLSVLWERCQADSEAVDLLRQILEHLHREHLLTVDQAEDGTPRYACHPILRDHFRGHLLGRVALIRDTAKLMAEQPDALKPQSLEGIQLIVTAIEALLDAGEVEAADDLFTTRLDQGHLFLNLPAPHWGMEVARWFVRDKKRCFALREQLSTRALGFYLNAVALFADSAGESDTALKFYPRAVEVNRQDEDWKNVAIDLQNLGDTETSLGLLVPAQGHIAESIQMAREIEDKEQTRICLSWDGFIASMQGDLSRADLAFAEANAIHIPSDPEGADLYSLLGILWAEHIVRSGDLMRSRALTEANRKISQDENKYQHIGRCEWMLGWLDVVEGHWDAAAGHLDAAIEIFIRGHMIYEQAHTLVTASACRLGQGDYKAALTACERAIQLAAPRNYRLVHADALIQRARIWLRLPTPDAGRARDDAEAALQLAEFCGYAWGRRDANELLAIAYRLLNQPEESARYQAQFEHWTRRLTRDDGGRS